MKTLGTYSHLRKMSILESMLKPDGFRNNQNGLHI